METNVHQISVGDLAAMVESGTWGPFLFLNVLGFLGPNRKILNAKLFKIKISIDLDSLRAYRLLDVY